MAHKTLAIIAALSLIGVVFLVYLALTFESPDATRTVEVERPIPRPIETTQFAPASDEPPTQAPLTSVEPVTPPEIEFETPDGVEPLPPLGESDSFVFSQVASMELGASLLRMLTPEDLIRKFVVFVHNASQSELPQMEYPVRRIESEFVVREIDDNLYEMDPATHRRFDPFIETLAALDPEQGMRVYRALHPLFREAFAEMGYQNGDFDETVIRAIDQVMNARTETGPFQLIKPSLMYVYAESHIEDMTPIEKQLLRMGPENTARLKQILPAYRERLQAGR
jgi:hypothetical protein